MSRIDFDEFAYKLYKEDWGSRISIDRKLDSIKDWYENGGDVSYSEYLEEQGYNGEFYACYEEFLDNEFQDREYMDGLLKRGSLKHQYHEFLDEMERDR